MPLGIGAWRWYSTPDPRILLLSVMLQVGLALWLGHSYDTRVFMAAGYLVGSGHSPYVGQDLLAVFHHPGFESTSTIGYPPPWPLLLGLAYRASYALVPNLLVYGLAIKIPLIAATVALAYLAAGLLQNLGAEASVCRKAWTFLLLNPLILYFGAAWGQIDIIVALIALTALVLLASNRTVASGLILALAVCFKPVAAPVALVVVLYLLSLRSRSEAAAYAGVFAAGVAIFYFLPFLLFGWGLPAGRLAYAHFTMSGSMSFMSIVLPFGLEAHGLTGAWWLLGLAWIPALIAATLALRHAVADFPDLLVKASALVLVFFLTRTWLAEPDVVLLILLVLLAVSLHRLKRWTLALLWILPLVFTVLHRSPVRLLWVNWPDAMNAGLSFLGQGSGLMIGRAILAALWQILGWSTVFLCLRVRRAEQPALPVPALGKWRPRSREGAAR